MKYFSHFSFRIFALLWLFLLTPTITLAADTCETPLFTKTYLMEMEAYNKSIREILEKHDPACIAPKVMIFGKEVTFISEKEDQISKAFLEKYGDSAIGDLRKDLNASNIRTSPLLLQDLGLVEAQLNDMRYLMNKSVDICADVMVNDVQGQTTRAISLSIDVQGRYLAYRQIYAWMLQPNQTSISYPSGLSKELQDLTYPLLDRYTTATKQQNPFSGITDYRDATLSSCQSQELGVEDINASLQGLVDSVKAIGQTTQEFADGVGSIFTEDLKNLAIAKTDFSGLLGQVQLRGNGTTIVTGQGVQKGEEAAFTRRLVEGVLGIPFDEFYEGAKKISGFNDSLRLNGAPVKDFTFSQLQNQIIRIDSNGKIIQKSLTDIPVTYSQEVYKIDQKKEEALEQYMAKNYDTLGKYATAQYFIGKMDQMTDTLAKINNTVSSAADDFTFVCQTHLHTNKDDCGELKRK